VGIGIRHQGRASGKGIRQEGAGVPGRDYKEEAFDVIQLMTNSSRDAIRVYKKMGYTKDGFVAMEKEIRSSS